MDSRDSVKNRVSMKNSNSNKYVGRNIMQQLAIKLGDINPSLFNSSI